MGTQYKLSENQIIILNLLSTMEDGFFNEEDLLNEEERNTLDKLCEEMAENYEVGCDDVIKNVKQLIHFNYISDDLQLTCDGKQYLEVGYIPESTVNNITNNNIENQKIINADKYVERNAPAVELGSVASFTGVSVENNESVVCGAIKEVVKGVVQGIANKKHK